MAKKVIPMDESFGVRELSPTLLKKEFDRWREARQLAFDAACRQLYQETRQAWPGTIVQRADLCRYLNGQMKPKTLALFSLCKVLNVHRDRITEPVWKEKTQ